MFLLSRSPRRGATLLDYGLIAVLIVIVSIPVLAAVGGNVAGIFGGATSALEGTAPDSVSEGEVAISDFTASAPATVTGEPLAFTATHPDATAWQWDFETDGEIDSTDQATTHTFTEPDTYTVTLIATSPAGSDTSTQQIIVLSPEPDAEFTYSPVSPTAGQLVTFSGPTDNIDTYAWEFGDGDTSTLANPTHTFVALGAYEVQLTVEGPSGTDSAMQTVTVSAAPPTADFSASASTIAAGAAVTFTDSSTGAVSAWAWDFDDGATSTLQNPTHAFASAGAYTVTLSATGPGGADSHSETITVVAPPSANFTVNGDTYPGFMPFIVQSGESASFADTSTGAVTSWAWSFGDGGTSTLENPTHTYNVAAETEFTATLTVSGPGGSDSQSYQVAVVVGGGGTGDPPPEEGTGKG